MKIKDMVFCQKFYSILLVLIMILFAGNTWAGSLDAKKSAEKAIALVNQELESALAESSASRMLAIYSNDAQLLPPNGGIVSGRENIREFWQGAIDQGVGGARLETLELNVHKGQAIEVGTFIILNKAGDQIDNGKYIVIWKKERGAWKYHRDIWNSSNVSN